MPRYLIFLFAIFLTVSTDLVAQNSLWGNLEKGKYEVGLRLKTIKDSEGRPIEIFLWYPAKNSKNVKSMTFVEYYKLSEKNLKDVQLSESLAQDITGDSKGIDKDTTDKILNSKMKASRETPMIKGKFPLILWSSRHSTVVSQSVLSEYLASYGFIVAFAQYAGEPLPFPFQINEPEKKLEVLETHVKGLESALSNLRLMKNGDAEKIAVISWSYGGESALKLQMRQSDIDLVIGLSSIRFDRGPYQGRFMLEAKKLNIPYVLLWETIGTNGQPEPIPLIFNELPKESYYLEFKELRHGNFNVLEGFIPSLFGIKKVQPWSKNDGFAQIGYETICRYSLSYLDYFLKGKKMSNSLLEKGLPNGFVKTNKFGK
ncbi:MAG: hypothetical protein AB1757_25345 [Acidobacteriota bacterium]